MALVVVAQDKVWSMLELGSEVPVEHRIDKGLIVKEVSAFISKHRSFLDVVFGISLKPSTTQIGEAVVGLFWRGYSKCSGLHVEYHVRGTS